MPSKRYLEIKKLYTTLGLSSLTKTEVSYLLKQLESAELILEKISRLGYDNTKDMLNGVKKYLDEREKGLTK